jgi:hypothetical protein
MKKPLKRGALLTHKKYGYLYCIYGVNERNKTYHVICVDAAHSEYSPGFGAKCNLGFNTTEIHYNAIN